MLSKLNVRAPCLSPFTDVEMLALCQSAGTSLGPAPDELSSSDAELGSGRGWHPVRTL